MGAFDPTDFETFYLGLYGGRDAEPVARYLAANGALEVAHLACGWRHRQATVRPRGEAMRSPHRQTAPTWRRSF